MADVKVTKSDLVTRLLDKWHRMACEVARDTGRHTKATDVSDAIRTCMRDLESLARARQPESEAAWAVRALDAWRRNEPLVRQYTIGSRFGMVLVTLERQGVFLQSWTGDSEDAARIAAARALAAEDPTLPQPPEEPSDGR